MRGKVRIFTMGFTKKSAERFFGLLEGAGVKRVIDIRLYNVSQLAGFSKKGDLTFFLKRFGMGYVHEPLLSPTPSMYHRLIREHGSWAVYERQFLKLMKERKIETAIAPDVVHEGSLLCSEETPEHCHRRLVAEYLQRAWGRGVEIVHLV